MEKELRNLKGEFKVSERSIKGYAIVFNHESRDLGGFTEVILPSAVNQELLDNSGVKVYLNHDHQRGILARSRNGKGSLSYELDERGVQYYFEAPNTALGDEVVEGLLRGDYNESSFAFVVEKDQWQKREDGTPLDIATSGTQGYYSYSIPFTTINNVVCFPIANNNVVFMKEFLITAKRMHCSSQIPHGVGLFYEANSGNVLYIDEKRYGVAYNGYAIIKYYK